ncbi:MAG: endonuclease III [Firmicutes bacterium]|nr:endonuclease III [Bacillota bacterium]
MEQSEKVNEIFEYLTEMFGEAPECELNYESDIQLMVAIILSAQCTDKRVNIVTKTLFKKYKDVHDFANADMDELGQDIYSTGFYKNKSRNIIAMAKEVIGKHGGVIPKDMDELTKLAGVGRKTASVFMAEFYDIPAIAVDTHVIRVGNRLGLTESKNPIVIERDLKQIFDERNWAAYHFYLVLFGRYFCVARNPKCEECRIKEFCKHYNKVIH